MRVILATSTRDFDPTEVAIPWKILSDAGIDVLFATDTGEVGSADPLMLSGDGFGILKNVLIARHDARDAYAAMLKSAAFQAPMKYKDINPAEFDGLVLPGGHAKGIIPYLESEDLPSVIVAFFKADKPVGAICHGVVAACRAHDPDTGKSVLYGRKTTALLHRQEMLAYKLTRAKMDDYYLTYPVSVEDEVTANLQTSADFIHGPTPMLRDSPKHLSRGFTVQDGNYISARWPGDAYSFGLKFLEMLRA